MGTPAKDLELSNALIYLKREYKQYRSGNPARFSSGRTLQNDVVTPNINANDRKILHVDKMDSQDVCFTLRGLR